MGSGHFPPPAAKARSPIANYFAFARGSSLGGFLSSANSKPLRYASFTIFAIFSKLIFSTVSVTAGFHALNLSMFELARGYKQSGMTAYSRLQEKEFLREQQFGYEAVKHQRFVGTGYFDAVQQVITSGSTSTKALEGSTEEAQFTGGGDPNVLPGNGHAIATPWAMTMPEPLVIDSVMASCWEGSDELMPSGD